MDNEFPKIQRGNGVMNDNLATLGDIMLATKSKIDSLQTVANETKDQVKKTENTIQKIDQKNTPREINSYKLLVTTVVISIIGVFVSILSLLK